MSESVTEPLEEPRRPDVVRAVIASVRGARERKSLPKLLVGGGVAVVLAGAAALGLGAMVFHHGAPGKARSSADSRHTATRAGSPASPASTPVPVRPGVAAAAGGSGPGGPGSAGKGAAGQKGGAGKTVGRGSAASSVVSGSSGGASSSGGFKALAAVATSRIEGDASHRCIDVTNGSASSGTPLQIWDCNGNAQQKWQFVSGTIRSLGMCMTAAGSSNGAAIVIAQCNGASDQLFRLTSAHDIVRSGTSECVDVKDKQTSAGTRLQLWKCSGTSNQKWHTA